MNYKGYEISQEGNEVWVYKVQDFNPVHVFECGQCFRWNRENDGSYTGVAKKKVINVAFENEKLVIKNATLEDFKNIWFDYFDLGRDYSLIKKQIVKDEIMEKAVEYGYGIRILSQDIWETLISFIISANNRIPRIMKIVESISRIYGNEIKMGENSYYTFPEVSKLATSTLEKLEVCRGGFRCKYIINSSTMVNEGEVDLYKLKEISTDKAREELMKFNGVGPKVADCVLLYSGTKQEVFPTDVWVKRVMEILYFKRETTLKEIQDFSREYFGTLAGFAQQYLFYYARENKIGT